MSSSMLAACNTDWATRTSASIPTVTSEVVVVSETVLGGVSGKVGSAEDRGGGASGKVGLAEDRGGGVSGKVSVWSGGDSRRADSASRLVSSGNNCSK